MKVVLINRYFAPDESATSRMLFSLATRLAATGETVHVLASRSLHNDPTVRLPTKGDVQGVTVHRLATTSFGRDSLRGRMTDYATFHLAVIWRLLRLLRRGDVCVVCTDPPMLSVTALLPVMSRRAILVNWLMDLFPEVAAELGVGMRQGPTMRAALWLRDLSLRWARLNVAPMQRMADYLAERGLSPATLATVHHWSDGDAIRPLPRQQNPLREEWGIGDRFVVGYSGNFGRAHDFSTFLAAAARLKGHDNIVFVFVGGGHREASIRAAIAEQGLDNIILKPLQPRERLSETLSLPDLHLISLLPSMEPFVVPSKLYGILAAGRPCIFVGDPDGEIATVLRAARCGQSVLPGESDRLAELILELASKPEQRKVMERCAREMFDARFTEAAGIAAWRRVLAETARTPLTPAPSPLRQT